MKKWWNEFKEDLIFNIIMTFMSGGLLLVLIMFIIAAIKMMMWGAY